MLSSSGVFLTHPQHDCIVSTNPKRPATNYACGRHWFQPLLSSLWLAAITGRGATVKCTGSDFSARLNSFLSFTILLGMMAFRPAVGGAVGFQPVSPDELKMTAEAKAPGAPAIILFRQVDRADRGLKARDGVYLRRKLFAEGGRRDT